MSPSTIDDFGYSGVPWEKATPQNLQAVEAEYKERLTESAAAWDDLEQKARFLFSVLVAICSALFGWIFANAGAIDVHYLAGIWLLAGSLALATWMIGRGLSPLTYTVKGGVTPRDLDVSAWAPLLMGGEAEMCRLSGVRIKEYARGIANNDNSNTAKSVWVKRGIFTAVAALPLCILTPAMYLLFVPPFISFLFFFDSAHAAVIAPIGFAGFLILFLGLFVRLRV